MEPKRMSDPVRRDVTPNSTHVIKMRSIAMDFLTVRVQWQQWDWQLFVAVDGIQEKRRRL